jgi:hypothetical protein
VNIPTIIPDAICDLSFVTSAGAMVPRRGTSRAITNSGERRRGLGNLLNAALFSPLVIKNRI